MLKDLISSKKSLFRDGAHTELRAQASRIRGVSLLSGNPVANSREDSSGVSARVCENGAYGFSSMADLSSDAAEAVLRAATENADFMNAHTDLKKPAIAPLPYSREPLERELRETDQKFYLDVARRVDDYITKKYPDLAARRVIAREDSMEKLILTSDGADAHTLLDRSYVYVFLNALTPDGKPVELFEAYGGENAFCENFKDITQVCEGVDLLYERLMHKREGVYAEAGEKTVILGGMMTGMLAHEAVGHTVEADLVLGGSVAGPMLGKPVASELVSLTDFAHHAFGERCPLPVFVDDEGVVTSDAPIIENGILTGYMNNRETAARFGMPPRGNARAWAFSDEPLIRMRNTAVHPGRDRLEDMIASVDDGYLLLQSGNGQADTTGEFMFGVTMGYEIKKGKLGRALLDTTISGVAFDMLKTVDMVGDEVVWSSSGFCGKKQRMPVGMGGPALRCKVKIGGR